MIFHNAQELLKLLCYVIFFILHTNIFRKIGSTSTVPFKSRVTRALILFLESAYRQLRIRKEICLVKKIRFPSAISYINQELLLLSN